ncbi:hypothetical protein HK096_010040 [Nowakowskiella sp. JEL0078]|nr:hypothetical protein HK096_010040 [Nowakowskiella sp. JEL0078]
MSESLSRSEAESRHLRIKRASLIIKSTTQEHINQFYRLTIVVGNSNMCVNLTVYKEQTVEYLAKQIEAELCHKIASQGVNLALEVGMLHNAGMLPLMFSQKISDCLSTGETVFVTMSNADEEQSPLKDSYNSEKKSDLSTAESINDRLQEVLHNKIALKFFVEFCIEEYMVENLLFWFETEIYQTTKSEQRTLHATYIYLTFIQETSPLQINLTADTRKRIPWPFSSTPDVSIFDEAQIHINGIMKGHSYYRFEKSDKYIQLSKCRKEDPETFESARLTEDLHAHYNINFAAKEHLIKRIQEIPKNSSATMTSKLGFSMESLNDAPENNSILRQINDCKEIILSTAMCEYFPIDKSLEGYFSDTQRINWSKKHKKMMKATKLHKFFGQRPNADQMRIQTEKSIESIVSLSLTEEIPAVVNVENDGEDDIVSKRKKVEKLQGFFGDKLPSKQLKVQKLMIGDSPVLLDENGNSVVDSDDMSSSESSLGTESGEFVIPASNTNELDADQRRILTKRSNKLQAVLGTSLNEATVQRIITDNVIPKEVIQKESEFQEIQEKLSPDFEKNESYSDDEDEDVTQSNRAQKRSMKKINKFLGEQISVVHLQEISAPALSMAKMAPKPLTEEQRNVAKKRLGKLERILGVLPPPDTLSSNIAPTAPVIRTSVYKTIQSFSVALQSGDFLDLLERLTDTSDNVTPINLSNYPNGNKETRQKKLKKLRKFFGDSTDLVGIIETQILSELENSLKEESTDPEEIQQAKEEMKVIRETLRSQSNIFRQEMGMTNASPRASRVSVSGRLSTDIRLSRNNMKSSQPLPPLNSSLQRTSLPDQPILKPSLPDARNSAFSPLKRPVKGLTPLNNQLGPRSASILQEIENIRQERQSNPRMRKNSENSIELESNNSSTEFKQEFFPRVSTVDSYNLQSSHLMRMDNQEDNFNDSGELPIEERIRSPRTSSPRSSLVRSRKSSVLSPICAKPTSPDVGSPISFNQSFSRRSSLACMKLPVCADIISDFAKMKREVFGLKDLVVLTEVYQRGSPEDETSKSINTGGQEDNAIKPTNLFVASLRLTTIASIPVLRRKPYAMKIYNKNILEELGLSKSVITEKKILQMIDNRFVTKFLTSFQDYDRLYMVMEWLPSNLAYILETRAKFIGFDEAKFFIGEIVLGLEYLHLSKILHRDIQPSNILLDRSGHVRYVIDFVHYRFKPFVSIGDFGCAIFLENNGTAYGQCQEISAYMAPEPTKSVNINLATIGRLEYYYINF